jgi:hypothetical protein
MASKIKRSQFKTFLNLGTYGTPVWTLLGDGVVSAAIAYNPKITEETYIINDSASISVDSYAPKLPIEGSAKAGDAVFDFVDDLRKGRMIGASAEVDIVNVWLYTTPSLGFYLAERQAATLSVEEFGGEGGIAAKIKYSLGFIGNPVIGAFSPTDLDFLPHPVSAILTTMVIGSVTLSPLFANNHAWLHYSGSVPNGTTQVSMTSTLSGATIVQYDEGVVVNQGNNASLGVGINHLTIDVTKDGENVVYFIDITRAAS